MTLYEPTICGAPLSAFAKPPTPEELATIIAAWDSKRQAMFLIMLAGAMRNNSGNKHEARWVNLGLTLAAEEERILDGEASRMLAAIAEGMKAGAAEENHGPLGPLTNRSVAAEG